MFRILSIAWFVGFTFFSAGDKGLTLGIAIGAFLGIPMALAFFAGMEVKE